MNFLKEKLNAGILNNIAFHKQENAKEFLWVKDADNGINKNNGRWRKIVLKKNSICLKGTSVSCCKSRGHTILILKY